MRSILVVGILVTVALAGCTSGDDAGDRDGDGLEDAQETAGWMIHVVTMERSFDLHVESDPDDPDTDGDGVLDVFEFVLGLNPHDDDTDDDGLTDCQEARHTVLDECEDRSWQGEGDRGYGTAGHLADSDATSSRYVAARPELFGHYDRGPAGNVLRGDGISDGDELAGWTITLPGGAQRQVTTDPLLADTDQDFLEDAYEIFIFNSDPSVKDTDGDGCQDGRDPFPVNQQRYDIGLQSLLWDEPGEGGSTHVSFAMSVADTYVGVPESETIQISHGSRKDLQGTTPAVSERQCSYDPIEPWVRIDLQVARFDAQGVYQGPLDVQSTTVPDGFSVWWHVRDGDFAWEKAGPRLAHDGPLTWRGEAGEVSFVPNVRLS